MEYRPKRYINEQWDSLLEQARGFDFENILTEGDAWKKVNIPHNWDNYHGYHKVSHGNLHGTAWYKKAIEIHYETDKHYFISFEGVGSYADVWVNGIYIGRHEGGRTIFGLDISEAVNKEGGENLVLVKADHPEKIDDLPWVCGGCFGTPNTEGSQPLGIHRPVAVYETGSVRILPFGVWITTPEINAKQAKVSIRTELKNLSTEQKTVILCSEILDPDGNVIHRLTEQISLSVGQTVEAEQLGVVETPQLWCLEQPVLYRVESTVKELPKWTENQTVLDRVSNTFGIRTFEWEHFENNPNEELSLELLNEAPSKENNLFVTYTRSDENATVGIVPGGVEVTLPQYGKDGTVIEFSITVENRNEHPHKITVESFVQDYKETKSIFNIITEIVLLPGEKKVIKQHTDTLHYLDEWSEEHPQLHSVVTTIRDADENLKEYNQTKATFGIFPTEGLANKRYPYISKKMTHDIQRRFLINGKPVFINGTCEYEHLLGCDHAFYREQIDARMNQIKAAGFNGFREAHSPHPLRYLEYCDEQGILYWAQMGAHLYFENKRFTKNFMNLTKEWVRERRNSPSVFLWGIQNESMLPADFTNELREMIRSLDETSPAQRKVVTCNGGFGSDWNVPQNWSGTYGRSVEGYDEEVREQALIGEYGQYRVLGKHEEGDMEPRQNSGGDVSEELFTYCLGTKIRLAEKVKNSIYGHFQWIFNSHANPGREEMFCLDGSGLDGVGVINSKGLISSWGELTDAYYMYRSYYAPVEAEPMAYIVSHTWADRFETGSACADITVYSNCDSIELMNDYRDKSLGVLENKGKGVPFVFNNVKIKYDVLFARGYRHGSVVAEDVIVLKHLGEAPNKAELFKNAENLTAGQGDYIYRMNCGGSEFTDCNGQVWEADKQYQPGSYGWKSWAMAYDDVDDRLGSVRRTDDPVLNSKDQELLQSFRYGREKLEYVFPVEDGSYEIEMYFIEPWYGVGGGLDCRGWRVFDVAVNEKTVIKDLDIWAEVGCLNAVKKVVRAEAEDGVLRIHFPKVKSYQGVISAIAVKLSAAHREERDKI